MGIQKSKNNVCSGIRGCSGILLFLVFGAMVLWSGCKDRQEVGVRGGQEIVKLGIDVFIEKHLDQIIHVMTKTNLYPIIKNGQRKWVIMEMSKCL